MSLLKQTTLRFRGDGHLRFDLPATLPPVARQQVAASLRRRHGIYRISLAAKSGKLSLRYLPELISFQQALEALAEALRVVTAVPPTELPPLAESAWESVLGASRRWFQGKSQEARETAEALRIVSRRTRGSAWTARGATRTVLNDLLIIYLIKTHWALIYRYWLRRPFEHKNHWVALTYLLFLLVRARRAHVG